MALKFLNKKGWHTGSLRNIENVWKAEQKHEAEQKKLEELRKQIHDERERDEFRQLQQQAGILPIQERLEFLYDSGLAVGKGRSEGVDFKVVDKLNDTTGTALSSSAAGASSSSAVVPGALFEEKGTSANDAWRKLHTDPLLLIRQREQEALARIKNNPVQMAMIRKSVIKKSEDKDREKKGDKKKHSHKHSKHKKHLASPVDSDDGSDEERARKSRSHKSSRRHGHGRRVGSDLEDELGERGSREKRTTSYDFKTREQSSYGSSDFKSRRDSDRDADRRSKRESYESEGRPDSRKEGRSVAEGRRVGSDLEDELGERGSREKRTASYDFKTREQSSYGSSDFKSRRDGDRDADRRSKRESYESEGRPDSRKEGRSVAEGSHYRQDNSGGDRHESHGRRRNAVPKLSEEEQAARLREMQKDAELHEEQRWKRLKKADADDAQAVKQDAPSQGRSFLDAAHRSIYGAEKGGSSTIEESVRRRTHYSQRSETAESNAFRR